MQLSNAHAVALAENRGPGALRSETAPATCEKLLERLWYYLKRFQRLVHMHARSLLLVDAPGADVFISKFRPDVPFATHTLSVVLKHLSEQSTQTTINFAWCFGVIAKNLARFELFGVYWQQQLDVAAALPFKAGLLAINLATVAGQYVFKEQASGCA